MDDYMTKDISVILKRKHVVVKTYQHLSKLREGRIAQSRAA